MNRVIGTDWPEGQYEYAQAELTRLTAELDYVDNERFARVGNAAEEFVYLKAQHDGCCGSLDEIIDTPHGRVMIGCNWGH